MKVKKAIALLLAVTLIFSIVGCTKVSKDEKKDTTTTTEESTTKKNKSEKETTTETQTTQPTSETTTTTKAKTKTKAAAVKNQSVVKSETPTTTQPTTVPSTTEPTTKSPAITITDTSGQVISIDKPLSRIVILNSNLGNVLKAFGVADRVVGRATSVTDTAFSSAVDVGKWNDPDAEKIIALNPDAVFAYSNPTYFPAATRTALEKAGIKCILIDFNYETHVVSDMTSLGKLFGCEAKAQVYIDFYNKYKDIISTRLADVSDKKRVYYEGYSEYVSVNKNDGGHLLVVGAGGINIAENEGLTETGKGTSPKISDEWIITQKPDFIIKSTSTKTILGPSVTDTTDVKKFYNNLVTRPHQKNSDKTDNVEYNAKYCWKTSLDAAKKDKVMIISSDIATNATGGIIGKLYIAKFMYPDKFSNIDVRSVHEELMKNFYGQDLTGIYMYTEYKGL